MHESTIDRNALEQLRQGVIPWTVVVPSGVDPLGFFTSRHIGRAIHGFTLRPNGVWKPGGGDSSTCTHLMHDTGCLPQLDSDFATNLVRLTQEITRSPQNGLQSVSYSERAAAWYRGLTAFPHLYPTALRNINRTPFEGS